MMNENAKSNITQLLNSFDTFVGIFEDPSWVKSAQVEDIKTAFKLGNFIEKTVADCDSKNIFNEFMNILVKWWKIKNRTIVYDHSFYQYACDKLLIKFFRYENVSETSLDIAVRIYTSLFPKERMQNVISELILSSSNMNAVYEFVNICIPKEDARIIEYQLKLKYWSSLIETGQENVVLIEIKDLLSLYKVEAALYLLIGAISVQDCTDSEKQIQNIILENVLEKMIDRSLLSKAFWLTMFQKIDLDVICNACNNFHEFLTSFFNFIMYIGSMMVKKDDVWTSDVNISLCPEITFYDILKHVKSLSKMNENKIFIISQLTEAKDYSDSDIWDQIKLEIENV